MIGRNVTLLKLDNFLAGLYALSMVLVIYFESITKSYAEAMLIFSISSIIKVIMEIPTGVFSDKIGRKKTMILSSFLFFITALIWATAGNLDNVLLLYIGAIIFGISDAFLSGTNEALMFETVEELKKQGEFDVLFSRCNGWLQLGFVCSSIIAALVIYFFDMKVLAWLSIVPMFMSVCVACMYVEPSIGREKKEITSVKMFIKSMKEIYTNKKACLFSLLDIMENALGMSCHRFEVAYFSTLIPLWAVNLARLLKQVTGVISFFVVSKLKRIGASKLLFGSMIGNAFVRVFGVILDNVFTPFIMSTVNLFYGTAETIRKDVLQHEFSSKQRATMGSIVSFFSNIVMAVLMYVLGYVADVYTPYCAICVVVVIKVLLIVVSIPVLRKFL